MYFKCLNKNEEWTGKITKYVNKISYCEFWINSRSSIMTIIGSTSRGNFACFPDFKVGCHLSKLDDKFWNQERLTEILGTVDGITVACALQTLSNKINI